MKGKKIKNISNRKAYIKINKINALVREKERDR